MLRRILALLIRSLRADSRARQFALLRFGLLLVTVAYLAIISINRLGFGAPGLFFFYGIAYINFVAITIAGVTVFPSAITEEKEERTLGLLTMAGIDQAAILLGKAMPRVINAILLLTVQFPFTLLAITLGGITSAQVFAAYMALLAYILLVAAIGLLWSVIFRTTNAAQSMALVTILGFLIGPPAVLETLRGLDGMGYLSLADPLPGFAERVLDLVYSASPFRKMLFILATGFGGSAFSYQVVTNCAAAVVLFMIAWLCFERFSGTEKPLGPNRSLKSRRRQSWVAPRRVWDRALVWKDFYFIAGGWRFVLAQVILFPLLLALFVAIGTWSQGRPPEFTTVRRIALIASIAAFLILPIAFAARVFSEELKANTHSGLMLLPMTVNHLAYNKVAGCLIATGPVLLYLAAAFLSDLSDLPPEFGEFFTGFGIWVFLSIYIFVFHMTALLSLSIKNAAFPVSLLICYIGGGLVAMVCNVLVRLYQFPENAVLTLLVLCAFLGAAAMHLAIGRRLVSLAAED